MDATLDINVISRGIIAGCVSISVSPSNFVGWTSLVNGILGGIFWVYSCKLFHIFEYDDTTQITQTHGSMALYSLFSVCLFHKTEGFLFKDLGS